MDSFALFFFILFVFYYIVNLLNQINACQAQVKRLKACLEEATRSHMTPPRNSEINYVAVISTTQTGGDQWLTKIFTNPMELVPILNTLIVEEFDDYLFQDDEVLKQLEDLSDSLGDYIVLFQDLFDVNVNWFKFNSTCDFTYIPKV